MKTLINNNIRKIDDYLNKLSSLSSVYKILIIAALLILIFFPGIKQYLENIFNTDIFYDDERQYLPPFQKYLPNPIPSDYIKDYYLNVTMPWGFKALMAFIYAHFDIQLSIGLIKLTTMLSTIFALGMVACEIGGATIAFSSITLFLSSPIFNWAAMAGVTPRIFIYLFLLLALLGILRKNIWLVASMCVIPLFTYPQTTIMTGIMMATWLLLTPKSNILSINNLNYKIKILFLSFLAIICFLITKLQFPNEYMIYGDRLTQRDIFSYPEIFIGGRYGITDFLPYTFFFKDFFITLIRMVPEDLLSETYSPYIFISIYFSILVLISNQIKNVYLNNQKVTAVIILLATALIAHTAACLFAPYLYIPSRYIHFPLPIIMVLLVPISLRAWFQNYCGFRKNISTVITAIIISVYALMCYSSLGGDFYFDIASNDKTQEINSPEGNTMSLAGKKSLTSSFLSYYESEIKLQKNLETLPTNILIAGWPNGFTNNIPLLAHRNVLLTFETHQVFFLNYAEEMRKRFYNILDVYFATSLEPLIKLRNNFGVTHFLVEKRYLSGEENLTYFKPFDKAIKQKLQESTLKSSTLKSSILTSISIKKAIIFENEDVALIDLSKL